MHVGGYGQFRTAEFQFKPENLSSPKNEGIILSIGKYGTNVSGVLVSETGLKISLNTPPIFKFWRGKQH